MKRLEQLVARFWAQSSEHRFCLGNAVAICGASVVGMIAGGQIGPFIAAAAVATCNYWLRVNESRANA